ncbi:MAG: RNA polymerase sigma factor [Lachnospiraceae bacterium]
MEDNLKQAIEQMKKGEEKGFNAVYSATYNRVYFRAKQIMKKEEDAQDLTQIVFIEAYKNIHSLQASEALYSWLDGITYNQGMKIYRKQKDILLTEEAEGMFDVIESNDISSMPELTADQKATADIIKGIIEELPELQKAAVVAYYFDGFKVEQIAAMMECSVNTIKSRLNYARKYIKERVEEKEKKEGYRLHVFGLPVLWLAIKAMAEKTTLTAQTAQRVYNGACFNVGLQATAISVGGVTAAATAGQIATATGIGAKIASLSIAAKTLIIAGTVAVAGLGTAGIVSVINNNVPAETVEDENTDDLTIEDDLAQYLSISNVDDKSKIIYAEKVSDTEYCFRAEILAETFSENERLRLVSSLPKQFGVSFVRFNFPTNLTHPAQTMNEYHDVSFELQLGYDIIVEVDYMGNVTYEVLREDFSEQNDTTDRAMFELTESVQRQISAFVAAAYQCNYSSVNRGDGWNIFSMTPDDCLFFVKDYIDMVNYTWNGGATPDAADLPYDWFYYKVTEQEFADFCRYGLGIEIPSEYTFSFKNEGGSIKIADGELRSTFDARTVQVAGGNVEIVSQDENSIVLSGICYWYDPEKTVYQFTVSGVPGGNSDIFGGMTITNIEITEAVQEAVQSQKTLADIDLSRYIKMQSDNSYTEIEGGYFTHTDVPFYIRVTPMGLLEGYWTLDGQELYFIGDDMSDMVVQDLNGNPLDIHIGLYTMGDLDTNQACMYVYTTATDFRDYPNYVYIK